MVFPEVRETRWGAISERAAFARAPRVRLGKVGRDLRARRIRARRRRTRLDIAPGNACDCAL